MSNYTKATNFATKDTLPTGDANKIVKGTEIDNEFNSISGAISSKADVASPTFTGTPAAPTATVGSNTTQVATTAFVFAERTSTSTLTNKTVDLTNNTVTGTVAQFNTALSDGNFATIAGTETLTNKTLTNPTITTGSFSNPTVTTGSFSSPALTGVPTAPTASAGTNTTQLATTAFVTAALSAVYPVGSIYVNAAVSTNPATLLGFGTWEAFGTGRVMVGLNASDALFDTLEETGGSKDAVLVSHTHTATSTDSGHSHDMVATSGVVLTGGGNQVVPRDISTNTTFTTNTATANITTTNSTEGSSGTNANVQPYIVVRMWKRTA
jgi:hypothetical protein